MAADEQGINQLLAWGRFSERLADLDAQPHKGLDILHALHAKVRGANFEKRDEGQWIETIQETVRRLQALEEAALGEAVTQAPAAAEPQPVTTRVAAWRQLLDAEVREVVLAAFAVGGEEAEDAARSRFPAVIEALFGRGTQPLSPVRQPHDLLGRHTGRPGDVPRGSEKAVGRLRVAETRLTDFVGGLLDTEAIDARVRASNVEAQVAASQRQVLNLLLKRHDGDQRASREQDGEILRAAGITFIALTEDSTTSFEYYDERELTHLGGACDAALGVGRRLLMPGRAPRR